VRIAALANGEVPGRWPLLEPLLARINAKLDGFSLKGLYQAAIKGEVDVWEVGPEDAPVAVFVTRVDTRVEGRVLQILHAAGEIMPHWETIEQTLRTLARHTDCIHGEIWGRAGWIRALAKINPRRARTVAYLPLDVDNP
jgi:hypothetical protein